MKESVGGTYAAYLEKEAEWDSVLDVVRVKGGLEKVLMFVSGVCMYVCVEFGVAEVYLYI